MTVEILLGESGGRCDTIALEQGVDGRVVSAELAVEFGGILGATAR